jgi:hypothetical protein
MLHLSTIVAANAGETGAVHGLRAGVGAGGKAAERRLRVVSQLRVPEHPVEAALLLLQSLERRTERQQRPVRSERPVVVRLTTGVTCWCRRLIKMYLDQYRIWISNYSYELTNILVRSLIELVP